MMMKILKRKQKYTNIVLTYSNVNIMSEHGTTRQEAGLTRTGV